MKKQDPIEQLFASVKEQVDIVTPAEDHKIRFLEKLQQQQKVVSIPQQTQQKKSWIRPLMTAASILIFLGTIATTFLLAAPREKAELASVSPQMKETQEFFNIAIQTQLEKINAHSSPATTQLIEDAMRQLTRLELHYEILKKDLIHSNHDERVISAMILNFQKRASLLENVLQQIQTIHALKKDTYEQDIL